jgi:hypothetical protein
MENNWIKNLKVGDSVYTIDRHKNIPGGSWKWKSEITIIESSYIETVYRRERGLAWLEAAILKLAPNHRTFEKTWSKNYFAPDGSINIELIENI